MNKYIACWALVLSLGCKSAGAADIVLTQILPLTGAIAPNAQGVMIGTKAYIDGVNAAGGVNGNRIVLDTQDDQYKPDETLRLARKSIAEVRPLALINLMGATGVEVVMKSGELEKNKVPLIGARSGSQTLRDPVNSFVFHTYAGYWDEVDRIVEVFASTGTTRFALVYQDDLFGRDGLAGMQAALKKRGLELIAAAAFPRGTTDIGAAGEKVMQANPQAVILYTVSAPVAEFLKRFREKMPGVHLAGISPIDAATLVKLSGTKLARGFVIAQNMPSPSKSSIAFVREHRSLLAKYAPAGTQPNYYTLGGHATAKVIVEALKHAGPKPTREKFMAALESIRDFDIGGVLYTYGYGVRVGVRFVDLLIIDARGEPLT